MQRHRLAALGAVVILAVTAGITPTLVGAEGGIARPAPEAGAVVKASLSGPLRAAAPSAREQIDAVATAGPSRFVPITPYRMYDSRLETNPWFANEQAIYDATTDFEDVPQIPSSASGVVFNVTVVTFGGAGFVQILTPGGTFGSTSSVNWNAPGQFVANGGSVGLVNSGMQIYVGGNAAAVTDILIDITGYYVAG